FRSFLYNPLLPEAHINALPNNYMIKNLYADNLSGTLKPPGNSDIITARHRITAGVVMHKDYGSSRFPYRLFERLPGMNRRICQRPLRNLVFAQKPVFRIEEHSNKYLLLKIFKPRGKI